jgi:hypothetical protein
MTPGFLLPFGHRHSLVGSSCSRPGTGPSSRSADRAPNARTRTGFPRSAPSRYDRSGCLLDPGDGGALLARCRARPAPAASQRPVPVTPRGTQARGINGGSRDSPARPAPRLLLPDGTGALGLSPVLRTPPLPATHDRAGPGMSTRPELRRRHNRPSNPRVPSQGATSCRNGR